MKEPTATKCAGCDRATHGMLDIELFPHATVQLCPGRTRIQSTFVSSGRDRFATVSASCLRRAREKLSRCPGCGAADHVPGTLCRECRAAIARSKSLTDRGSLRWYALNLSSFISYLSSSLLPDADVSVRERVGRLLMRACAASTYSDKVPAGESYTWLGDRGSSNGWVGCPAAELTEAQATALTELLGELRPLVELYYLAGEQSGQNILRQLRDGNLSTTEFDERTDKRLAKLHARRETKT